MNRFDPHGQTKVGSRKAHAYALLGACTNILAIGAMVTWMNKPVPRQKAAQESKTLELLTPPKPKPKRSKPKPKQRQKRRRRAAAPRPNLNMNLSSLGSGAALFQVDLAAVSTDQLLSESSDEIKDLVMSAETVDQLPKPMGPCQPQLSRGLIKQRESGLVKVKLLITAQGQTERIDVVESSPPSLYDSAVVTAMQSCQWRPAMYKGTARNVVTYKTFRFKRG